MGCINVEPPPLPPLPFPFTIPPIQIPLPGFPGLNVCCRLPPVPLPPIPIPLPTGSFFAPPIVTAATLVVKNAIKAVTDYINALPLKCPLE